MFDVLVVDDDDSIRITVTSGLRARNFSVQAVSKGQEAIEAMRNNEAKVLVLDLGLPDIDGVDVVRIVRTFSNSPIIVLSADGSDSRKVLALELGADDYVTKPFSIAELVARVRVAIRHQIRSSPAQTNDEVFNVGLLRLDIKEHFCSIDNQPIDLTPKEFSMLSALAARPGSLVTHRVLLRTVWGDDYLNESHYLRVYASHIRKKLGEGPGIPEIKSEAGVGYRLVLEQQ
jgi:two-component system KDP operon response regulator KdpE